MVPRRSLFAYLLSLTILISACSGGSVNQEPITPTMPDSDPTLLSASPTLPAGTPDQESTPSPTPDPFPDPVLKVIGDEETVFDWGNDRCADHQIPDLAMRAFRGGDGQVQAISSSDNNYRLLGPDLNHLTIDCSKIMASHHNPDPAMFTDAEWIAATYTEDGQTIYALIHNEYQGHQHPGQCPQNDYFSCWDNSITLGISTDGGQSYGPAFEPPAHLIARFPYPYQAGAGPEGFRAPSNIIKGKDGYFYNFFNVSEYLTQNQWVCLMRSDDLSQPRSWRFWDGNGFEGQFVDPYGDEIVDPDQHICPPIDQDAIGHALNESITYNTYLGRYVLVGISADWLDNREVWGFYYAISNDLVSWSKRKLLMEIALPWTVAFPGSDMSYLYPSLLDPESESRNFETSGKTAYLYYTRNNFGHASLDRDLVRVPVEFFPSEQ